MAYDQPREVVIRGVAGNNPHVVNTVGFDGLAVALIDGDGNQVVPGGVTSAGGTTPYRNVDVDESEDQISATAGQVYWVHAMNLAASVMYLHLYNATAATVVVGTTVPDLTFALPTQGSANGAGFTINFPSGVEFDTAITIAATTTVGGASGPGANEVLVNLGYAS